MPERSSYFSICFRLKQDFNVEKIFYDWRDLLSLGISLCVCVYLGLCFILYRRWFSYFMCQIEINRQFKILISFSVRLPTKFKVKRNHSRRLFRFGIVDQLSICTNGCYSHWQNISRALSLFSPIRNSTNVDSLRRLPFALSSVQFAWFSW